MADLLVRLYALPDAAPALARVRSQGIEIRRACAYEKDAVAAWVRRHFSARLAAEADAAMVSRPVTCFLAVTKDTSRAIGPAPYDLAAEPALGFACYDVTARGLFGPAGVRADRRGAGIGTALLLASLHAMAAEGYAYAVIGWAGPVAFYARAVGATLIEGSEPGIYRGPLVDDAPASSPGVGGCG
jgi:GNAT superfamily N-acetyltransferase